MDCPFPAIGSKAQSSLFDLQLPFLNAESAAALKSARSESRFVFHVIFQTLLRHCDEKDELCVQVHSKSEDLVSMTE